MKKIFCVLALAVSLLTGSAWAAPHVHCRDAGFVREGEFSARVSGRNAKVYYQGRQVARLSLGETVPGPEDSGEISYFYPADEYSLKVTTGGLALLTTAVLYETDFDSMPLAYLDKCE